MERELRERIAANQDTFREINESILRGQWPGEGDGTVRFRCECARLGCNLLIEVNLEDYERVRGHSRRFMVVIGHELPAVESVVESGKGYLVVEKRGSAGAAADDLDPRG